MLAIPQDSSFKLDLARKLLLLVEKAHQEFDRSQNEDKWAWEDDTTPITLDEKVYRVRLRFGFAERFFGIEVLKTDIGELGNIGRERVPFGFIAHDEDSNEIYVVFRGTMTPAEWITNLQFKPGCEPFLNDVRLGKVHRGFHKIYTRKDVGPNPVKSNDGRPSIKDCIEEAIRDCSPDAQVYVTGHSLGGALATMATLHIHVLEHFRTPPILYAFANPRAGGLEFYQRFHGLECFRIANSEDIVPTLPLPSIDLTSSSEVSDTASNSLKSTGLIRPRFFSGLRPDLDYHHIGEPIYFANHKGAVADNHIIPAYKEALGMI